LDSEVEGPFDEEEGDDQERIREMIRQRIQSLPEGLREGVDDEAVDQEAPGVDLAPGGLPDAFGSGDDDDNDDDGDQNLRRLSASEQRPMPRLAVWRGEMGRPRFAASATPDEDDAERRVRILLAPEAREQTVGEEAMISVLVDAPISVSHLPLTLKYDPAALEIVRVERGSFFGGPDEAALLSDKSRPGRVLIGASRLGEEPGVSGRGEVARLIVRLKKPGRTVVRFRKGTALDAELEKLPVRRRAARLFGVESTDRLPTQDSGSVPQRQPREGEETEPPGVVERSMEAARRTA
jgi:hypothetical protein